MINEATTAYEEKRWQDALLRYQAVVQRTDGKQLRVFNGLYNSYTKLGKAKEAETAFEDIVKLGLATNNLWFGCCSILEARNFGKTRPSAGSTPCGCARLPL